MSEIYLPPESEKARGSVEISNGGDKMTGNRQEEKQAQGLLLHIGKLFVAGTWIQLAASTARRSNPPQLLTFIRNTAVLYFVIY